MNKILCALVAACVFPASASIRHYAASIETSDWKITSDNRLQCTLKHHVPGYGDALFTSMASKKLNMEFELAMQRLPKTYDVAAVYSVPPSWMPGEMQRKIADMPIRKQYTGDLPEQTAWTILSELEKGFWPTIYYRDWYNQQDKVAVGLNASNFIKQYHAFSQCVSNLLPFSFEDISYSVLNYQKNSDEFTRQSEKKMAMIGEYLKEDTDIELVLLDAYTDSYGGSWHNEQLSVKRAEKVKRFFEEMGVAGDRIQVTGHGERRHIAANDDELAREKNRRVVIRMAKS
ncbi:OmpA family protein [Aliiglaciecola sp. CAU 1673]|uniref:flagellar protein MotY n=1 Tax=Aliiglaciecola sp. CAU 1673 TaxID=3032595 RepID=UPI0023DAF65E|nr:OmpA family protein [Aliiglaciecola sp. CAU 1673]MDF2179313.1 OmpA family protein [Aliiglaciecola sp. CAU 1673]